MRKRYLHNSYGQDDLFWERNWLRTLTERCASGPKVHARLVRCIEKYLTPGIFLLEGGCGDCQYLRYFEDQGYAVIGLDFAQRTMRKIKKVLPRLSIIAGDIFTMPFPDSFFDAYYSGGVIEHFEGGVCTQLQEAHRVLKHDAYFFVSVPFLNPIRRLSGCFRKTAYRKDLDDRLTYYEERELAFEFEPPPEGYHFHEYLFSPREVRRMLKENGFSIVEECAFSPVAGLWDISWFMSLVGRGKKRRTIVNKAFAAPIRYCAWAESHDSYVCRLLSALNCALLGNMRLYVCRVCKI